MGNKTKFAWYCTCGAAWKGEFPSRDRDKLPKLQAIWAKAHSGPEHKSCDRETAERAYRATEGLVR